MRIYSSLVDDVAELHFRYCPPAGCSPNAFVVPGSWLPAAVDNTTSASSMKLPVVVAFGANYATGPGKMPSVLTKRHRSSVPWVEDPLGRQRARVFKFLDACATGKTKPHWNGLLPFDPGLPYHRNFAVSQNPERHFVMANASPWITTHDWSKIRNASLEDIFGVLARPNMATCGLWSYFRDLGKCVGRDAIWVGHGNAEIYGIFRLICNELGIAEWFFDSNLSQPSLMIV